MNLSEEHIRQLEALEQREKSNTHRIDELDEKINKLDEKVSKLSDVYVALTKVDDKVSNVEKDVSTIKTDLKDLKEKPSKRYEQIVSLIITRHRNSYIGLFFGKIRIIERRNKMKNLDVKSFVTISFTIALIILLFITVIFKSEDVFNSVFLLFTNLATAVFTYFFTKKSSGKESEKNETTVEQSENN